ncbi:hypothetical protein [Acidipropionibacterium thoenii]|uniref:hypothetical protein n=1 Tax=Acidipropionibacterium thoenii TaxID=1751 RepID=UPI0003F5C149|nr:hypothetical protein [Acidipropionibacterium thoenii]
MEFTFVVSMVIILLVAAGIAGVVWAGLREPRRPVEGSGITASAARIGRVLNGDEEASTLLSPAREPVRNARR